MTADEQDNLHTILDEAVKGSTGLPDAEPRLGQRMLTGHLDTSMSARRHFAGKAPTGSGKALDVATPIPTPAGWTPMGDLHVGDIVFDERGHPEEVLSTSDIAEGHPCFAVTFADGSEIVADAEHLWTVVDLERLNGHVTVTTEGLSTVVGTPAVPVPRRGLIIEGAGWLHPPLRCGAEALGRGIADGRISSLEDDLGCLLRAPDAYRALVHDGMDQAAGQRVLSHRDLGGVATEVRPALTELLISVGRRPGPIVAALGGSFMPIVSVVEVPSRPVRCITVSSPSALYLAGPSMVATHNSISYLSPAMARAASGERTVISTQSLSLQAQIRDKDAPAVAQAVEDETGYRPSLAILKGWSNYACPLAAVDVSAEIRGAHIPLAAAAELATLRDSHSVHQDAPLAEWVLAQAIEGGSGDRATCPVPITDDQWGKVTVSSDECPGRKRCSMGSICLPGKARDAADAADVVVTNHSMLAIQAARAVPVVIGRSDARPFDHLVVDEAHTLASTVRSQGASVLGANRLVAAARRFESVMNDLNERRARSVVNDLFSLADQLDAELARHLGSEKVVKIGPDENPISQTAITIENVVDVMLEMIRLNRTGGGLFSRSDLKATRVQSRLTALRDDVRLAAGGEAGVARWIQLENTGASSPTGKRWTGASVLLSLVDVAGRLRRNLYTAQETPTGSGGDDSDTVAGPPVSVSAVSATISQPVVKEMGLDAVLTTYPSPFGDAFARSLLYVPRDVAGALLVTAPGRKRASMDIERHMSWALDHMATLVEANGGSALVLASTARAGRQYADALRQRSRGWAVHSTWQDGTKEQTISRWKDDHSSVLVGTRGLMTGVDAPGTTCTLVIVDRVPRSAPNPPDDERVAQLCRILGINQWEADRLVYVEDAAMLLEQAAGRLIRSANDGGVVAVLDPRLHRSYPATYNKASRERYLAALSEFPRTSNPEVAMGVIATNRSLSGVA